MIAFMLFICKQKNIELNQTNIIGIAVFGLVFDIYIAYAIANSIKPFF